MRPKAKGAPAGSGPHGRGAVPGGWIGLFPAPSANEPTRRARRRELAPGSCTTPTFAVPRRVPSARAEHEMDGASSSSDDGGDETPDEARFIEEMYKAHEKMKVDPETERQMEIVAEVARRREQDEPARLRVKSDAIFGRFDVDADGFLSFAELSALGEATGGGELSQLAYGAGCHEIGADP